MAMLELATGSAGTRQIPADFCFIAYRLTALRPGLSGSHVPRTLGEKVVVYLSHNGREPIRPTLMLG